MAQDSLDAVPFLFPMHNMCSDVSSLYLLYLLETVILKDELNIPKCMIWHRSSLSKITARATNVLYQRAAAIFYDSGIPAKLQL